MKILVKLPYQPEFEATLDQLKAKVTASEIDPITAFAWYDGLSEWVTLDQLIDPIPKVVMPPPLPVFQTPKKHNELVSSTSRANSPRLTHQLTSLSNKITLWKFICRAIKEEFHATVFLLGISLFIIPGLFCIPGIVFENIFLGNIQGKYSKGFLGIIQAVSNPINLVVGLIFWGLVGVLLSNIIINFCNHKIRSVWKEWEREKIRKKREHNNDANKTATRFIFYFIGNAIHITFFIFALLMLLVLLFGLLFS